MIVFEPKNVARIQNSLGFYVFAIIFSAEQFSLYKTGVITKNMWIRRSAIERYPSHRTKGLA